MREEELGRLRLEREFHDGWARTIDARKLDPDRIYGCPTTPEVTYAISALGDLEGKRILDLGAGSGESSVLFAKGGAEVVAADISPQMCAVARQLAQSHRVLHRVHPVVMAGEFQVFPDAWFDCVFGEDILHHLDLNRALPEVRRVLKKGGAAVFIEPLGHNPILNLFRSISPSTRTPTEHPLRMRDFKKIARIFPGFRHSEFHLMTLLLFLWFFVGEHSDPNRERYWKKIIDEADKYGKPFKFLYALDRLVLFAIPYLKRHCRMTVIECRK